METGGVAPKRLQTAEAGFYFDAGPDRAKNNPNLVKEKKHKRISYPELLKMVLSGGAVQKFHRDYVEKNKKTGFDDKRSEDEVEKHKEDNVTFNAVLYKKDRHLVLRIQYFLYGRPNYFRHTADTDKTDYCLVTYNRDGTYHIEVKTEGEVRDRAAICPGALDLGCPFGQKKAEQPWQGLKNNSYEKKSKT